MSPSKFCPLLWPTVLTPIPVNETRSLNMLLKSTGEILKKAAYERLTGTVMLEKKKEKKKEKLLLKSHPSGIFPLFLHSKSIRTRPICRTCSCTEPTRP